MTAHFIGSAIGAVGAVASAWISRRNGLAIKEVHLSINGSLDERVQMAVSRALASEREQNKNPPEV